MVQEEEEPDENDDDPDYIKSEVDEDEEEVTGMSSQHENEASEDDTSHDKQVDIVDNPPPQPDPPSNPTTFLITRKGRILINPPVQKCDLCFSKIPLGNIFEHLRGHVGDSYLLKCPNQECRLIFSQPRSVSDHLRSSICGDSVSAADKKACKDAYTTCEICGFSFHRPVHLKRHLLREHQHSGDKMFPCPFTGCKEAFTFKQTAALHLSHHQRGNAGPLQQRCRLCQRNIKVEAMEAHLKTNHKSSEIIKCTHCPFLFPNRNLLLNHLFDHRFDMLFCDICKDGVLYNFHGKLRRHYFEVHKIGHVYACEQCDNVYFSVDCLRNHVKDQHNNDKKEEAAADDLPGPPPAKKVKKVVTLKCKDCGQEWKRDQSFRDHVRKSYAAEPVKCRFCEKTFPRRCLLEQHEKAEHGEEMSAEKVKPKFRCDFPGCGKEFVAKPSVELHMSRVHRRERPHVCEYCGKAFSYEQGLKQHRNGAHLGIRPHVCEFCGEGFTDAYILEAHTRTHTDERPFACEICGQRFRQEGSLTKHRDGHRKKGTEFMPKGLLKVVRKRVARKT